MRYHSNHFSVHSLLLCLIYSDYNGYCYGVFDTSCGFNSENSRLYRCSGCLIHSPVVPLFTLFLHFLLKLHSWAVIVSHLYSLSIYSITDHPSSRWKCLQIHNTAWHQHTNPSTRCDRCRNGSRSLQHRSITQNTTLVCGWNTTTLLLHTPPSLCPIRCLLISLNCISCSSSFYSLLFITLCHSFSIPLLLFSFLPSPTGVFL